MSPYFSRIEHLALDLRRQLALDTDARLEPNVVLERMDVDLFESPHDIPGIPAAAAAQLCMPDSGFSGAGAEVLGRRLVFLNPSHSEERRRVTTMEEAAHFLFGHRPTSIRVTELPVPCREYHGEQEREAYAFAAATLLPKSMIDALLAGRLSLAAMMCHFGVSRQLVEYRAKTTGVWTLYRSVDAA